MSTTPQTLQTQRNELVEAFRQATEAIDRIAGRPGSLESRHVLLQAVLLGAREQFAMKLLVERITLALRAQLWFQVKVWQLALDGDARELLPSAATAALPGAVVREKSLYTLAATYPQLLRDGFGQPARPTVPMHPDHHPDQQRQQGQDAPGPAAGCKECPCP